MIERNNPRFRADLPRSMSAPPPAEHHRHNGLAQGSQWLQRIRPAMARYPAALLAAAFSTGVILGWWIKRHK